MTHQYDYPKVVTDIDGLRLAWEPTPQEVVTRKVAERIALDHEGKVRQALIDLGWTPPPENQ